jgi:hypothetical protein
VSSALKRSSSDGESASARVVDHVGDAAVTADVDASSVSRRRRTRRSAAVRDAWLASRKRIARDTSVCTIQLA